MPEKIGLVASAVSTIYYRGFRPSNGEFRKEHFEWLCLAADSKIKQDEYNQQVLTNLRLRLINAPIILSDDNYTTVTLNVKDDKVKLPYPIMSFSGDNAIIGVDSVTPVGQCKPFIRINPEEDWTVCDYKDVVFWKPAGNFIEFKHLENNCKVDKVTVRYIGNLNANAVIQDSRKWSIINMVISFIKAAKDGTVIDMSNDGNANTASQTEINKYILKALQRL